MYIETVIITKDINENIKNLTGEKIIIGEKNSMNHLILTGKNGSGKTLLLREIAKYTKEILLAQNIKKTISTLRRKNNINIVFNEINRPSKNFIYFFRSAVDSKFITEENLIMPAENIHSYMHNDNIGMFVNDFLIKLKFEQFNINESRQVNPERTPEVKRSVAIARWFLKLQKSLALLFSVDKVTLEFTYNDVLVRQGEDNCVKLIDLSDGYKSIFNLIGEILIRGYNEDFTLPSNYTGIVIIDEIENHLHIDFQRKIMKILTDLFPKIQFIVSTHSPFIITSLANSTVFDMENSKTFNDMTPVDYKAVVKSYFGIQEYSILIEEKAKNLSKLVTSFTTDSQTEEEKESFEQLIKYFDDVDQKYISMSILNSVNKSLIQYYNYNKKKE